MVKISTLNVVVSRNSENLNVFRFILIDLLCERCSMPSLQCPFYND